ncbi:MAG: PH domain-containing protein [Candidatus Bathyarchaeota archaeon]|nr:PH domain-containing protein [Candidatus Bathyarchaeota archaeon]MDH5754480.1 PH domain-containing protein [Candidatus Bathyarchaeota archaeon]
MAVIKEYGADRELKKLYLVYLGIVLVGGFLWWLTPVVIFVMLSLEMWIGVMVALSSFVPLLIVVGFVLYWVPKFYSSITYLLEDDKITVTKGVWWKTKSFVPYNRITNINIYQGPISRRFGLGKLSIQTAGFSGTSSSGARVAEAVIFGIKNFEEIKDIIIKFVRGMKPEAIEAEAEVKPSKDINQQILAELRKIRKAIEK